MGLRSFQHFFQREFAGIDGQHFFDLRELFFQELFRPQTEGEFTTSVKVPADELQRNPAVLRISFQQFSVTLGQLFKPGFELRKSIVNLLFKCHCQPSLSLWS